MRFSCIPLFDDNYDGYERLIEIPMLKPVVRVHSKLSQLLRKVNNLTFSLSQLIHCCNCIVHWFGMSFELLSAFNNEEAILVPLKKCFACIHNAVVIILFANNHISRITKFNLDDSITALNAVGCTLDLLHALTVASKNKYYSHRKSKEFRKLCKLLKSNYDLEDELLSYVVRFEPLSREWLFVEIESYFMNLERTEKLLILEICAGIFNIR